MPFPQPCACGSTVAAAGAGALSSVSELPQATSATPNIATTNASFFIGPSIGERTRLLGYRRLASGRIARRRRSFDRKHQAKDGAGCCSSARRDAGELAVVLDRDALR